MEQLSKKDLLEKVIHYTKDPKVFMQEQWFTNDARNKFQYGIINPYEYQLDFIKNINSNKMNLVLKGRQMHVTSMMTLYIAWCVLFRYDKNVLIIAPSSESAKRILEDIKIIIQNYFNFLEKNGLEKEDFIINNKLHIKLKNGSTIQARGPSPDAGRGCMIDLLYCDEPAFIKNFDDMWYGLGMCISHKEGKAIIASTPSDNSFFNNLCLHAKENSSTNLIKLHWSIHPVYSKDIKKNTDLDSPYEYTSPWFDEMCKRFNNNSAIEQELECIVNYKNQTSKSKTISLRIDNELYNKIKSKLKDNESASDYIRNLIEKDLS